MTLKDLIESCLVSDEDKLKLAASGVCVTGHWFNDPVLNLLDYRIESMEMERYPEGARWEIILDGDQE